MKFSPFAKIPLQALCDGRLTGGDVRVLACLHYHAFKEKTTCNPSHARLMDETTMSDKGVKDSLKRLKAAGYIDIEEVIDPTNGRNKSNKYTLKIPAEGEESSPYREVFSVKGADMGEKSSYESDSGETEEKKHCAKRVSSSLGEREKEYVPSDGFSYVNDEQETRSTLPPGGLTSMGSVVRDVDYMEDAQIMRSGTVAQAFRYFGRLCASQDRERVERALVELSKRSDVPRESVESILEDNGFQDLGVGH